MRPNVYSHRKLLQKVFEAVDLQIPTEANLTSCCYNLRQCCSSNRKENEPPMKTQRDENKHHHSALSSPY
ncbi:hypothetical protein ATANTOWER_001847 [Ataeniobius toweri]|uniref:Uncharacterized protein n=1 Tax=Ataeniobius toweri TaxID=208326 RepID=A0ABU7C533_9TELE|nr:hypothetical protein [Ataeniobius toweri]